MTDDISTTPAQSRTGPAPSPGTGRAPQDGLVPPPARLQRWEIVTVLAVSLGASGLYALVSLIGSLTAKQSLSKQTAPVEEVFVVGSLLRGRARLGVRPPRATALSAVIRGSYPLYRGVGGFLGNAVMGLIFGSLYRRWGRVMPLLIAHFLIDAVTF